MSGARVSITSLQAVSLPSPCWDSSRLQCQQEGVAPPNLRNCNDVLEAVRMEATEDARLRVAGVAHDFNNVLSAIRLNCDRISAVAADRAQVRRLTGRIQELEAFARTQVDELLLLGHCRPGNAEGCNANQVVRAMLPMLQQLCGELEVRARFGTQAGHTVMSAASFRQVVLNLVLNARDAAGKGGRILIETWRGRKTEGRLRAGLFLGVWNSGRRIGDATLEEMERPFFTSKARAGHGWGLLTVRRVVAEAGGEVRIEGRRQGGTRIVVSLSGRKSKRNGMVLVQSAKKRGTSQRQSEGRTVRRFPC